MKKNINNNQIKQKNVLVYTRVSTVEQANSGYSLNSQEEECKKFTSDNNLNIKEIFREKGESAKTTERTELKTLMNYCTQSGKNIDYILVWKIDRLSRNMQDFYTLTSFFNKFNISIISATENNDDTSTGRLTRNVLGAFAQFENDQKSERVEAGMKQTFSEGKWLWKPPYGYKMENCTMVINPETAPTVKRIFEMFGTGLYRQSDICNILEKENIHISPSKMYYLLKQILYTGYMYKPEWEPEPVKCITPGIINKDLYYKVQSILNNNKTQITAYTRNNPLFPLRQFIICPFCGTPLTASNSTSRNKKYAYYHCYNNKCNSKIRIPKNTLEKMFAEYLKLIIPNECTCNQFKTEIINNYKIMTQNVSNTTKRLKVELRDIENKKNKLIDLYIDEKIQEADYNLKSQNFESQIETIKNKLYSVDNPTINIENCIEFVFESLSKLDKVWLESDLDTKQKLQQLIFPNGLIYGEKGFRNSSEDSLFTKKGALATPNFKMVLPGEFESPSPP